MTSPTMRQLEPFEVPLRTHAEEIHRAIEEAHSGLVRVTLQETATRLTEDDCLVFRAGLPSLRLHPAEDMGSIVGFALNLTDRGACLKAPDGSCVMVEYDAVHDVRPYASSAHHSPS